MWWVQENEGAVMVLRVMVVVIVVVVVAVDGAS